MKERKCLLSLTFGVFEVCCNLQTVTTKAIFSTAKRDEWEGNGLGWFCSNWLKREMDSSTVVKRGRYMYPKQDIFVAMVGVHECVYCWPRGMQQYQHLYCHYYEAHIGWLGHPSFSGKECRIHGRGARINGCLEDFTNRICTPAWDLVWSF